MLKLVIFAAILALSSAAPQFHPYAVYNPYTYPYAYSHLPYLRSPIDPAPGHYPLIPYYALPYQPLFTPPQPTPLSAPVPAPAPAPAPSPVHVQPKPVQPQNIPLPPPAIKKTPTIYSASDVELSEEVAKLYLTPEQQALFEAAVASMNPLEYAAQLDTIQQQQMKN